MKHSIKVTLILIAMFFVSQLIGIFVIGSYAPITKTITDLEGNTFEEVSYGLPFGLDPPSGLTPETSLISIVIAMTIAILFMLVLIKFKVELFLRIWFFVVVALALAVSFNSIIKNMESALVISLSLGIFLAFFKVFKRHILVHNVTELFIYPGIAAIFVPLVNIWSAVILLIIISLYDAYAVWHSGIMQKMAKYQMEQVKVFSGFFIPYLGKNQKQKLKGLKESQLKKKKVKVNVAILGGGDVVFPMILAGAVLTVFGLIPALIIALGATLALGTLFYYSEKGKFYPAMPFISAGCFIALGLVYLLF